MNKSYRKTLIAAAVTALISVPAWSVAGMPDVDETSDLQSQTAHSSSGENWSIDGSTRAKASNNRLYTYTPDDLKGMKVVGPDGKSLGKIKTVVMDRSREDVHAVISTGGMMGIGTRDTLVPIAELELLEDDEVRANLTKEAIAERPEFKEEQYGVMESDRRISDFSAFEPALSATSHASAHTDSDAHESSRAAERSSARSGTETQPSQVTTRSELSNDPMHSRTPMDLKDMEVVGRDCQNIGKVKTIVASNNRDELHAVISSGGFLGLGTREILVPLNELEVVGGEQLQADFNQDTVESRPEYKSGEYAEVDSDRKLSEHWRSNR